MGHAQRLEAIDNFVPDGWRSTETGLLVPDLRRRYDLPVAVELFAGCGGASVGLHQAGFHVVAAVEMDAYAAMTYMHNLAQPGVRIHFDTPEREADFERRLTKTMGLKPNAKDKRRVTGVRHVAGGGWISHYDCDDPECVGHHMGFGYDGKWNEYLAELNRAPAHPFGCEHFWVADVRNLTGAEILDAIGLEVGDVDLVSGGPPCQGFSHIGKRDVLDFRNSLVFEFVRLVLEIRPKSLFMENVPGMASMVTPEGVNVVDAICHLLNEGDFGNFNAPKRAAGCMVSHFATCPAAAQFSGRSRAASPADPRRQHTFGAASGICIDCGSVDEGTECPGRPRSGQ